MDLYQQLILDHSKRPVNAGLREPFQAGENGADSGRQRRHGRKPAASAAAADG